MADSTTTSGLFSINVKDVLKGIVVAVLTSVLTVVYETVSKGSLTFDWKAIGIAAATSGFGYLIKNVFTPAQVVTPVEKTS
jgi:hypothetical protein